MLVAALVIGWVYWLWRHSGFDTESKHTNGD
jgi:hypothetical protein